MDIRVLRYFLAVAGEGSFTRAAENLHIAQPSLSRQIMELEHELGKQLFIRNKRKITLTEDGVLLRRRADEIVYLLEKTEKEMIHSDADNVSGIISIGGSVQPSLLAAASGLRNNYANIQFHFYSGDETDVAEQLNHGNLDFAAFMEPVDPLKYDVIPLPDTSCWGLLMRDDSPLAAHSVITAEDILAVPLIFHRRAGIQRRIALWAQTDPGQLNIAATYNVLNGSPVPFVKSGLGYFLTIRDLITPDTDGSICFRPLEPRLPVRYALVRKRHTVLSRAAQKFMESVKALCVQKG